MNTLFDICEKENLTYEELKEGIDKFGSEINRVNENQETTLMLLCKHNPKIELIKLMVDSGADVNISNVNNCLLYLFSSEKDFDIDVAEYFVELGCDIGYKINGCNNNTILHQIVINRVFSTKKLEILMKLKPDMINEVNDFKASPLIYLCEFYPELELIKLFVKYGADPKHFDSFGRNCLIYLFSSEKDFDLDVVEYLIELGCDIGKRDSLNNNILHEIIQGRVLTTKKLEILMKLKPDMINEKKFNKVTPLMYLCEHYPDLELVKRFVEYGAKVNAVDNENKNCLFHLFLSEEDFDIYVVEYLISQGCDIGHKNVHGNTILHEIVDYRFFAAKRIEMVLRIKPDMIDEVNTREKTPFMNLMEYSPELELIKLFIKHGANQEQKKQTYLRNVFLGDTLFDINLAEYLIDLGCDIGNKDFFNNILHEIIETMVFSTKKLEILMKLKPDMINEVNDLKITPLMYLCNYYPELELVKLFVKYGAKVDPVDYENKNCLFYLFNSRKDFNLNVAEYLISQGCKFTKSIGGSSVLSLFASDISFEKINFLAGYNQKIRNNVNVKVKEYFNFKNKLSFCSNQLFY